MNKKKLVEERLKDSVTDGKIACSRLRKIAEEADTSYKMAGRIADKLNIKIIKCELGCF
jgi:LAO/AO transport system kinase